MRATIYKATALVFCAFLFQTSHAQTFPFEVEQYFAYFKIPDKRQGGLQIFSPYIFLSKEKCIAQGVENKDAKQSIAYWPAGQIQQNCWAEFGANITTCPIAGKDKTGKLGNACIDIGKSRFLDISNIPKSANFDSKNTQTTPSQQCKQIYQARVYNYYLENICKFNGNVSNSLGIAAKTICGNSMSEATRQSFSNAVKKDIEKDIERLGDTQFCFDNKKSYEDLKNSK